MAQDQFLVAPIKDGLRTDLKPWMLPEGAFARLENAYMHEGVIRKRFGSSFTGSGWASGQTQQLFSRLAIPLSGGAAVGITDGSGDATGTVPGAIFKVGQIFSIGSEIFTVSALGTPGTMLKTGTTVTATYNTTTGVYVFARATINTQIYFYPSEPVMGLSNLETNKLNDRPAVAFDTQFAYQFAGGRWSCVGPTAGSYFHGEDSDFFKATNWNGVTSDSNLMFVTNFNATVPAAATDDPMWYYTGIAMTGWTAFQPVFIVGANFVRSSRIIIPFKDRLLLLNTVENDAGGGLGTNTAHPNRCRFSHNGSPVAASAFYEPNQVGSTGGGWIDAATKEEIVSAEFIKDRLVVYFENSTWELAYTGNSVQPFVWQKLNTELGSESTFSSVPFDKAILTIGTTGIHACNGANVERIDNEIPSQIFEVRNSNDGFLRVAGIRDYLIESVYWTFPSSDPDNFADTYPNKVLVYNYKDGTWAINDDSITAFGYFEQQTGTTWASTTDPWGIANFTWASGTLQAQFRKIVAGNQQGYVFSLEPDISTNAPTLQITNAVAGAGGTVTIDVTDHNLNEGDFIRITNCLGVTDLNDSIYPINTISDNQISILNSFFAGTYLGGGIISRVSRIDILTKQYNPYVGKGSNVSINSVDFAVEKTTYGAITVDYLTSSSSLSMVDHARGMGCNLGNNVLETSAYDLVPLEDYQTLLWHKIYFGASGDSIQLRIYFSNDQMYDSNIVSSDFKLEGFILNTSPAGRIS